MKFLVFVSAAFALPRSTVAVSASVIIDKTKYGRNESIFTHQKQYSSRRFIQKVQPLTPIAHFTRNIFDILFQPQ
ncbi:hypothetical protein TNCV_4798541 [Trichonephila clavipes]|nr:hypothetical protein TNCV_4798541 [Trichonephila clavipes]